MQDTTSILSELHDDYIGRINAAVAEDREDLILSLSSEFTDAALTAILDRADV